MRLSLIMKNSNYWHDDDHDIWYDSISSEEPTVDINDHLDTKNFNEKPTKDINDQADTKEPLEDEENDVWYDAKQKHRPFHLSIDHQKIGHREKGRQHQVMYTSQAVVDAMLSDLNWDELVGHHQPFDTICYAVSTTQKFQRLEDLQPTLA